MKGYIALSTTCKVHLVFLTNAISDHKTVLSVTCKVYLA